MVLTTLFITALVSATMIARKYFLFENIPLSCSILVYPIPFLIIHIVAEVYGKQQAKPLVMSGWVVGILVTVLVWIANRVPIHASSPVDADAFAQVLGVSWMVAGSSVAYLAALWGVLYFSAIASKRSKYLWLRYHGAALGNQLIAIVLISLLALVVQGPSIKLKTILAQCIVQGLITLLGTPMVYLGIYWTKKWIKL